ncbi:MAG: FixH family protein [Gammaproteobacteria bacterium]|nr:FixH family protein [Gammaproteobacteria bacterium]
MSFQRPRRGWSPLPDVMDDRPWYRHIWPWVLIALPLASVVASFTTLYIAMQDPDGLVKDDFYDTGVAIQARTDRMVAARQMGLAGELVLAPGGGEVDFEFAGNVPADAPELTLALRHATRAQFDVDLTLTAVDDGYTGELQAPLAPGNWNISLDPPDKAWRIRGRGFVSQDPRSDVTVELTP